MTGSRAHRPWVIAHRGQAGERENTLAGFEWAVQIGADMIECDIRRTRDGVLVTYHDPEIQGYRLQDLSYAQTRQLHPIPTLTETLQTLKGRIWLDLELKDSGYEWDVVQMVLQHSDPTQVIITSFLPAVLSEIHSYNTPLRLGILRGPTDPIPESLNGIHWILPHWQAPVLTDPSLVKVPMPIIPWTVNQRDTLIHLLQDPRIGGVITDRPRLTLALKQSLKSLPLES